MSATLDIDPTIKHALKLLHSSNTESTEKIRNLLDELIKQRYGNGKTLINTLSKKHLAEEPLAGGSNLHVRKQKVIEPKPVPVIDLDPDPEPVAAGTMECLVSAPEALTMPPVASGPILISTSDLEGNDSDDDVVMEEDKLKELEELMCVVCRLMDVSARNRLVECADCHALYHQECHKPAISESDANDEENAWYCTLCRSKQTINKLTPPPVVSTPPIPIATSPSPTIGTPTSKSSSSSHSKTSGGSSSSGSKPTESTSNSTSSGGSKHKSSSSKSGSSSSSKSSESSHERDRDRDRDRSDRDRDRERERDRDRDRERDRDRDKEREKSSKSSTGSSGTSSTGSAEKSSTGAGTVGTPNINIISADKRLQMMKKKAAKMQDSKRKHK